MAIRPRTIWASLSPTKLSRGLPPLGSTLVESQTWLTQPCTLFAAERSAANKVQGCVSQVWLSTKVDPNGGSPRLSFVGDSDAHIVRGLIAILFALYSGKTAQDIISIDAPHTLGLLHLKEHLTPQRSNGLMAMVKRIRSDAESSLAQRTIH